MAKKRIVVFSPHPDDAEYGAWGFLHQNRDEEITIVFVSGAVDRLHEATNAIFELGSKIIGLGEIDGSIKANAVNRSLLCTERFRATNKERPQRKSQSLDTA